MCAQLYFDLLDCCLELLALLVSTCLHLRKLFDQASHSLLHLAQLLLLCSSGFIVLSILSI